MDDPAAGCPPHPAVGSLFVKGGFLRYPVGNYVHYFVRLPGIIGEEVDRKVMRAVHTCMHYKYGGLNESALAWLKNHRTDG